MGPFMIIHSSPVFDHHSSLCQIVEELGIEAFTAKRTVEDFVAAIFATVYRVQSDSGESPGLSRKPSDYARRALARSRYEEYRRRP